MFSRFFLCSVGVNEQATLLFLVSHLPVTACSAVICNWKDILKAMNKTGGFLYVLMLKCFVQLPWSFNLWTAISSVNLRDFFARFFLLLECKKCKLLKHAKNGGVSPVCDSSGLGRVGRWETTKFPHKSHNGHSVHDPEMCGKFASFSRVFFFALTTNLCVRRIPEFLPWGFVYLAVFFV